LTPDPEAVAGEQCGGLRGGIGLGPGVHNINPNVARLERVPVTFEDVEDRLREHLVYKDHTGVANHAANAWQGGSLKVLGIETRERLAKIHKLLHRKLSV